MNLQNDNPGAAHGARAHQSIIRTLGRPTVAERPAIPANVWSGEKTAATNHERMHPDCVMVRRSAANSSRGSPARRSGTMASREAVLVTGATGFTGSRLARHLRQLGHPVRALVRPGAATDALRAAGVALIEGDIRNPPDVMRAAEDVSAIYHLAAAFRVAGQPDSFYRDVNVRGTANVWRRRKLTASSA